MKPYKYFYFLTVFLSVLIVMLTVCLIGLFRDLNEKKGMEQEYEYAKIRQVQADEYLYEQMNMNRLAGLDLTGEYVRTLDDMIYQLGNVEQAFPKVYVYFSTNYCKSCVDYMMEKLPQVNDSLGTSNVTLLFHNYEPRQLYVNKVKQGLKNEVYILGDMSVLVDILDEFSKPVIILTDEKGTVITAYSPSADWDALFNDYLNIVKTNALFRRCLKSAPDSTTDE